jgi:hypothetical protein
MAAMTTRGRTDEGRRRATAAGAARRRADDAAWLEAWLESRRDTELAAALAAQDDAEVAARRGGPEPEFMLGARGVGR